MWYNGSMDREWFDRNCSWITLLGLAVIIGLVYLGWKHGIAISFAVLAIFVATFFPSRSLKLTQDSLILTRATTRPFLNVVGGISVIWSRDDGRPTLINYFVIHIGNTGIFPADHVSVVLNVSKTNSDNQKHLFVVEGEIPSICFPGEEISNLTFRETKEKEQLNVANQDKLKVIIEISYQNKLTHQFHKTIRSYLAQYFPIEQREPTPLRRDDFWD